MKLVASTSLNAARRPRSVLCLPRSGEILLHEAGQWGTYVEAYDPELLSIWNARFGRSAFSLLLDAKGMPWMLDLAGASALGERGDPLARVAARVPEGMHVSACAWVDDGLVFALHHAPRGPMHAPIVQRVDTDGTLRWSTTLPAPLAEERVWRVRPRTWLSTSETLDVSGDVVLACFSDMPASGIGFGYALSLTDGALRFTTASGPMRSTAALGGGAFLVGYQGYGAFETQHYDRDGRVRTRWASQGHYVIAGDDIRVIELSNANPYAMHLARLLQDGSVVRGQRLGGYHTSPPSLRPDGTALFFREGALLAARDLVIDDRLDLCALDARTFFTPIAAGGESAYLALWEWRQDSQLGRLVRVDR
jgi:outer membrane protein assembly factor BamB